MSKVLTPKQERFYVYVLYDPRNGEIFYVGKGRKNRVFCHERYSETKMNPWKSQRIMEIKQAGVIVGTFIIAYYDTENEAYVAERELIDAIGLDHLTNIAPGRTTYAERTRAMADVMLQQVIPPDSWVQQQPRSHYDSWLYLQFILGLKKLSQCPDDYSNVVVSRQNYEQTQKTQSER